MQSIGQTDTLTIKLASAPATRNPSFWGSYAASSGGAMTDDQSIQPTVLNGTTPVTVLLTPPSGTKFYLTSFSMTNTDTAAVVASILLNGVAGITFTLQTGDVMQFGKNSDSWVVLGGNGAQKQALSLNWGQIGGTLSAQTDLQAALDAKANASSLGTAATHAATDFDPAGAAAAVTKTSLGLANVTNDAQTKAAVVPNTLPAAGQLMVGNAGGTAYAPVTASADVTVSNTGAMTIAASAVTLAKQSNLAANSIQGNNTGSPATPLALTAAQVQTMLLVQPLGNTSTATAGGTTTLTNASTQTQAFTGTLAQTLVLPAANTLAFVGWMYCIVNNSTGSITVQANGSGAVITVTPGMYANVTCTSIATSAGTWLVETIPLATANAPGAMPASSGLPPLLSAAGVDVPDSGVVGTFTAGAASIAPGTDQVSRYPIAAARTLSQASALTLATTGTPVVGNKIIACYALALGYTLSIVNGGPLANTLATFGATLPKPQGVIVYWDGTNYIFNGYVWI